MADPLSSLQNPRVKRVVKLRDRRGREREGAFLVEGFRELTRAVECQLPLEELYYCPEFFLGENEPSLMAQAQADCGAEVTEVTPEVFRKMTYRDRPEGLLAVAPLPPWSLAEWTPQPKGLYVVACAIEKPGNLGTILRCADAVGVAGVIVCDRCTDLFNPNVVRASIGTLFTVPVVEATSAETHLWLRQQSIRTVATSPDATETYSRALLTGGIAIVLGSEQYGLDEFWLKETDQQVSIPMQGAADSLNVAMATTVLLFEAQRQRLSDR